VGQRRWLVLRGDDHDVRVSRTIVRAIVVGNSGDGQGDAGLVGECLEQRGYELHGVSRDGDGPLASPQDADVVVLLGSDWSVYWDRVAPQVAREQRFVRDAMDHDVAVLAICYGAQLLTTALGGTVERSPTPEIGWHLVGTRHPSVPDGPWMQWHSDVCVLPAADQAGRSVEVLASNDVGPQAFRCGRAFATEFHPEATTDVVRRWAVAGERALARIGLAADELIARSVEVEGQARTQAFALVAWFCDEFT
jgi:GMP synthase-like glutamine amidotransferase